MVLAEGQVQVRDLVMGRGTPYRINKFNPWVRATRAAYVTDASWSDGASSGAEFRTQTTVNFRIGITAINQTELLEFQQDLDDAFRPIGTNPVEPELRWVTGGFEYLRFGRPSLLTPDHKNLRTGQEWAAAAMVCYDTGIYSAEEHSVSMGLLHRADGLVLPGVLPGYVYSPIADGQADITNTGKADARLLLRITGPVVDPRVTVIGPDGLARTLTVAISLESGEWLDIDTKARHVILNGTTSRLSSAFGSWPVLSAGASTIRYQSGTHNDQSQLSVRWRDSW